MRKKKGAGMPIELMIGLLVIIVFAALFGRFVYNKLTESGEVSVDVITAQSGQDDQVPGTEVKIDANIEEAYDEFIEIIEANKEKAGPCFFQYNKLPDLDKNSIRLSVDSGFLTIVLNNDLGQQVKWRQITGLSLCVVAGKKNDKAVAENFYDNYLKDSLARTNSNDVFETSEVIIFGDEDNLGYQLAGAGTVEGQRENKQLLYIPEKGKLCFLPTFDGDIFLVCSADEDGLDDDCFDTADINKFMQKQC